MSTGDKRTIQKAVISPVFAITTAIVFMVKYIMAISHFALIHWLPSKKKNIKCAGQRYPLPIKGVLLQALSAISAC